MYIITITRWADSGGVSAGKGDGWVCGWVRGSAAAMERVDVWCVCMGRIWWWGGVNGDAAINWPPTGAGRGWTGTMTTTTNRAPACRCSRCPPFAAVAARQWLARTGIAAVAAAAAAPDRRRSPHNCCCCWPATAVPWVNRRNVAARNRRSWANRRRSYRRTVVATGRNPTSVSCCRRRRRSCGNHRCRRRRRPSWRIAAASGNRLGCRRTVAGKSSWTPLPRFGRRRVRGVVSAIRDAVAAAVDLRRPPVAWPPFV